MRSDRWKQIDAVLDSVLSIATERRSHFLDDVCSGDPEMRAEIESLLKLELPSEKFLEDSAIRVLGRDIAANGPRAPQAMLLDREIGTYKIERLLGSGGMADVYLAHDRKLDRNVALKILQAELMRNPDRVRRFEREARAISTLNHPNIVTIFDVGETDGCHYIATELVDGKTLRELIGTLSLENILSIVSQVADALEAAHRNRIIHRDIKPENVMVRSDGYVKVLDFGLVKLTEPTEGQEVDFANTGAGMLLGTLAYMSPEQVTGEPVDHRTDLWSLGVVLYEMLVGKNPFKTEKRHTTLQKILEHEPASITEIDPSLPVELDGVVRKALAKDADLNYQNAAALAADVKRCLRNVASGEVSRSGDAGESRKRWRRPRWLIPAAGLLLAALGAGAAYFTQSAVPPGIVPPPHWSNAVASRLTDFPGEENFPALSPDAKVVAYAREVDGNVDIYWQRIGGGTPRNITADSPAVDTQPTFSPDGDRIAFRSDREGGGIFLMGATGESVVRLTNFGFNPAWARSGDEIAFTTIGTGNPGSRGPSRSDLWIARVRDGNSRLLETDIDAMGPAFSPSGVRIAVWSMDEKFRRDIWTVDRETGAAVRATDDTALDWNPVWSPDGKFLYFCSNRNGGHGIWRIPIDERTGVTTGEPEAALSPLTDSWMFTLSKDGQSLAYISRQRIENLRSIGFDSSRSETTGEPLVVTEGSRIVRSPNVSPDGRSLVYYQSNDGHQDIAISSTNGTGERFLTNDPARDRVPRFSPDGKKVLYYSDAGGNNYEIWSVNTDGSDRKMLITDPDHALCYPQWSPDGQRIAYSFIGGPTFVIDANRQQTGQVPFELPPLDAQGQQFIGWSWSPDGSRMAGKARGTFGDKAIYIYSFESNRYERIVDKGAEPFWLADNNRLMYLDDGKLFMIDLTDRAVKEVLAPKPLDISSAALSPDNKTIYYTLLSIESDIQLLSLK